MTGRPDAAFAAVKTLHELVTLTICLLTSEILHLSTNSSAESENPATICTPVNMKASTYNHNHNHKINL